MRWLSHPRAGFALAFALVLAEACGRAAVEARRGQQLYETGRWQEAYEAFNRASKAGGAEFQYDGGNALYRMKRYDDAAKHYRSALEGPPPLRQRSYYNLGNAHLRSAEDAGPAEKAVSLRKAVAAYEEALRLDPADADAKWNLELALRKLDEQESGGSAGRGRAADYGRGNMHTPGYEGNPEAAVGAMAGGGFGSAQGESVDELDETQARQLLEAVEREQLKSHEGRPMKGGSRGEKDW